MFDTDLVALLMHCTSLTIPLHNTTEQSHAGAIQAPVLITKALQCCLTLDNRSVV